MALKSRISQRRPQDAADLLVGLIVNPPVPHGIAKDPSYLVGLHAAPTAFEPQQLVNLSAEDPTLVTLQRCIKASDWSKCETACPTIKTDLQTVGKVVLRGLCMVIPTAAGCGVWMLEHERH